MTEVITGQIWIKQIKKFKYSILSCKMLRNTEKNIPGANYQDLNIFFFICFKYARYLHSLKPTSGSVM